jgi:hypothetical protein
MERSVPSLLRILLPGPLLVLTAACHGSHGSAPAPSFTVSVSPAALSIPAGGGGYATVTITRSGGFGDAVALSLDGAPAGVLGTGTIAASVQTAQLALLVAREVAPQSLDALRVKGTSGGLIQTGSFKLVITAPLPPGQISADLVQATGGVQRGGTMENTGLVQEPVKAGVAKDAGSAVEVRHGFNPSGRPN